MDIIIDRLIQPIGYKFGILETTLQLNWKKILHEPLALYSKPSGILFDKYTKENTLYITVDNGSVGLEIQYLTPIMIEKIAIIFGYKIIQKIKIRQL